MGVYWSLPQKKTSKTDPSNIERNENPKEGYFFERTSQVRKTPREGSTKGRNEREETKEEENQSGPRNKLVASHKRQPLHQGTWT